VAAAAAATEATRNDRCSLESVTGIQCEQDHDSCGLRLGKRKIALSSLRGTRCACTVQVMC